MSGSLVWCDTPCVNRRISASEQRVVKRALHCIAVSARGAGSWSQAIVNRTDVDESGLAAMGDVMVDSTGATLSASKVPNVT
jgi:hypothetical protein